MPPDNGVVDATCRAPGSRAVYSCAPNYTLSGQNQLICQNNGEWSGDMPTCKCMTIIRSSRLVAMPSTQPPLCDVKPSLHHFLCPSHHAHLLPPSLHFSLPSSLPLPFHQILPLLPPFSLPTSLPPWLHTYISPFLHPLLPRSPSVPSFHSYDLTINPSHHPISPSIYIIH